MQSVKTSLTLMYYELVPDVCILFQVMVFLSGVVAFSVNLSIFWIIGNTSPVTYPCSHINKLHTGVHAYIPS